MDGADHAGVGNLGETMGATADRLEDREVIARFAHLILQQEHGFGEHQAARREHNLLDSVDQRGVIVRKPGKYTLSAST
jgi:hypothetical protein